MTILQGDALEKLRELPDQSVQCCVTSPPYWGLRDYGTATWEGGNSDCDHKRSPTMRDGRNEDRATLSGSVATNSAQLILAANSVCGKCGATRIDSQIGLEETPEQYVSNMVEVFREVRRVLRNDGTLWLNLGDSYAGSGKGGNPEDSPFRKQATSYGSLMKIGDTARQAAVTNITRKSKEIGLKPKDLVGIPWRVAFALQADGWYLRSDIIWAKPNPMPESVTDRPTKAHEYLFLLSKSERYYYDAEAIEENAIARMQQRLTAPEEHPKAILYGGQNFVDGGISTTRNKRSVWTVPTAPYPEAHFATYPPDLIKPCILAGTKTGDTVLDPFAGSGTTGMVAIELARKALLIELNPQYIMLIQKRCHITPGLPLT